MTPDRLAEIRERVEAASPGPWFATTDTEWDGDCAAVERTRPPDHWGGTDCMHVIANLPGAKEYAVKQGPDNAAFIAHAREDVPDLLADRDALQALLREAREEIEHPVHDEITIPCPACALIARIDTALGGARGEGRVDA